MDSKGVATRMTVLVKTRESVSEINSSIRSSELERPAPVRRDEVTSRVIAWTSDCVVSFRCSKGGVIEFEDECVAGLHVVPAFRESLDERGDDAGKFGDAQAAFALRRCAQHVCGTFGIRNRAFAKCVDYEFE